MSDVISHYKLKMGNDATDSCDYEIRTVTLEDKPQVFDFLKKYFFTSEPLNESLNSLGRNIYHTYTAGNCILAIIEENLSFMAVTKSGEIIAYIQNAEVKSENNSDSEHGKYKPNLNPDVKQVRKLLYHMDEQIDLLAKLENSNGKELEVKSLTVHDAWRNKGIGKKLLEKTREFARQKGFKQIRSTCTSAYSAKVFANCGFECIYALKYEDWKNEGNMDFLPHPPHFYAKGMVLRF